jgi:hypothetical protein
MQERLCVWRDHSILRGGAAFSKDHLKILEALESRLSRALQRALSFGIRRPQTGCRGCKPGGLMMSVGGLLKRLARTLAIVAMVVAGSTVLIRFAPGYLSDAREMDARYGDAARASFRQRAARSASLKQMLSTEFGGWTRGDLGVSRQYDVPVA